MKASFKFNTSRQMDSGQGNLAIIRADGNGTSLREGIQKFAWATLPACKTK